MNYYRMGILAGPLIVLASLCAAFVPNNFSAGMLVGLAVAFGLGAIFCMTDFAAGCVLDALQKQKTETNQPVETEKS